MGMGKGGWGGIAVIGRGSWDGWRKVDEWHVRVDGVERRVVAGG